ELHRLGARALVFPLDVSDFDAVQSAANEVVATWGGTEPSRPSSGRHRSAPPPSPLRALHLPKWWSDRSPSLEDGRPRVILRPDTWGNHFEPEILIAAVNVLESAGFAVVVPRRPLCCGRPLYDYGMLDLARKLLREILEELRPALSAGIPIVGLEPSCIYVFRE